MDTPRARSCDEIETLLTSYVDGEDQDADRAAVTSHLAVCAPCRARAQAEQAARTVLRACRPALAVSAPARLRARCSALATRPSSGMRWVPLSMAATLVLAMAGALLYTVTFKTEALAASLAADHLKCYKLVDATASADPETVAREWERSRGWQLKVLPDVPVARLHFVGVRRCLSTEGMAAHLMYTFEGRPLSVFVWPEPDVAAGDIVVLGQKAVIWSSPDRMYAVVGAEPADRMARVAGYVRNGVWQ